MSSHGGFRSGEVTFGPAIELERPHGFAADDAVGDRPARNVDELIRPGAVPSIRMRVACGIGGHGQVLRAWLLPR